MSSFGPVHKGLFAAKGGLKQGTYVVLGNKPLGTVRKKKNGLALVSGKWYPESDLAVTHRRGIIKSANATRQIARLVDSGRAPLPLRLKQTRKQLGHSASRLMSAGKRSQRVIDLRESGKLAERLGAR